MERDPRKDPMPGDVTHGGSDVMLVVRRTSESVFWAYSGQQSNELYETPIEWWIRDSKHEEVIHVAGA